MRQPPALKTVFTTGDVAQLCHVTPRTVAKWVDRQGLGYRIPGSQDRRIPRDQLIRFLREHHMPLGELEWPVVHKVLLIGFSPAQVVFFQEYCGPDFQFVPVRSTFEAGLRVVECRPDRIVWNRRNVLLDERKIEALVQAGRFPAPLMSGAYTDTADLTLLVRDVKFMMSRREAG